MAALLSKSGSVEGATDCSHSWGGSKPAFPNSVSAWDFSDPNSNLLCTQYYEYLLPTITLARAQAGALPLSASRQP